MSTNAYIKYLTQQFVEYFSLTKTERKQSRQQRKDERPSLVSTWFGLIPFALTMFFKKIANKKQMS